MLVSENDETLSPKDNLTVVDVTPENNPGSSEPTGETRTPEEMSKIVKGFQKDQKESREREKAKDARLADMQKSLDERKTAEKQKKLDSMDEVDRFKAIAEEAVTDKGKLELRIYVNEQLEGRNLPKIAVDMLRNAPWAIPSVKADIGDSFSYDEAIASLKIHLPVYLDSLKVGNDDPTTEVPGDKPVDNERNISETTVVKNHFYTQDEIAKISTDQAEWAKHGDKILAQVADHGGTIPTGM